MVLRVTFYFLATTFILYDNTSEWADVKELASEEQQNHAISFRFGWVQFVLVGSISFWSKSKNIFHKSLIRT
jgi:hypothetical protein